MRNRGKMRWFTAYLDRRSKQKIQESSNEELINHILGLTKDRAKSLPADKALRFFFQLDEKLYTIQG